MLNYPELIIGLVAPIGSDLELIIKPLKENFNKLNYEVKEIKVTKLLDKRENITIKDKKIIEKYKAFDIYFEMETCTEFRLKKGRGYLATLIAKDIFEKRQKIGPNNGVVYLINQLKNIGENEILKRLYGENYFQISCFSSYVNRDKNLKNKCNVNKFSKNDIAREEKILLKYLEKITRKSNIKFKNHFESMFSDIIHKLLKKDYVELDHDYTDKKHNADNNENDDRKSYGQEVSKLFPKSDFFVDLDSLNITVQSKKIVELLFGIYDEFPTQDEFGMAIAYATSKRSNFPGTNHVGACVISQHGEVISAGSIRAPVSHSNPEKKDMKAIEEGYYKFKDQNKIFLRLIDEHINNSKEKSEEFIILKEWIKNSMEFHPCTHAEMSAISDAAKLGVSIRNATLYTTTFPCHMCAKDIVSCSINKVVFLEAFPKSKNEDLYSKIIDIDPSEQPRLGTIPFETFQGVGPRKYNYLYSLENKHEKTEFKGKNRKHKIYSSLIPPLLRYRGVSLYNNLEKDLKSWIDNKSKKKLAKNITDVFGDYLNPYKREVISKLKKSRKLNNKKRMKSKKRK